MTWVRIDESFPEHPKVVMAGGDAAWLHVCAMCYANRYLTDGFVPASVLNRLSDRRKPAALAARLVDAGVWDVVDNGWMIHDFLTYQPSKAKVENERANARERMANARAGSGNVRPNIDRSSHNPSPSVSVPLIKSSVSTSSGGSGKDDDDDGFTRAIDIVVEHKAWMHRPDNRLAWEIKVVPNTITELGAVIHAELDAGRTPIHAAGVALGSQRKAELAAGRLT